MKISYREKTSTLKHIDVKDIRNCFFKYINFIDWEINYFGVYTKKHVLLP